MNRSRQPTPRLTGLIVAAGLSSAFAACGNVTVGGFTRVTVDVSGDAADPAPQPGIVATADGLASPLRGVALPVTHGAEEAEGEVEIDLRLALLSESGEVVPLGHDDSFATQRAVAEILALVDLGISRQLRLSLRLVRLRLG